MNTEGKELEKAKQKYELANLLLKMLKKDDILTCAKDAPSKCPHVQSDATIIDFMGVMRKLTAVELTNVNTFGDLCKTFLRNISSYGSTSSEIHVVMENYKPISIKSAERKRRQGSIGELCRVVSDDQPLPDMRDFWSRTENKISLQNYFVSYCSRNYQLAKPLYLAGGSQTTQQSVHLSLMVILQKQNILGQLTKKLMIGLCSPSR